MSDLEWDAEDFEPDKQAPAAPKLSDKWDGEDEDDVKESWEDDDAEKKKAAAENAPARPTKTRKKIQDIVAEKEERKREEFERRKKEREEQERSLSPSEVLAEKIRMQKVREDSDLEIATDLLGSTPSDREEPEVSLDGVGVSNCDDLSSFRRAIIKKIRADEKVEKTQYFVTFIEDLVKDLCLNVETDDVKKISTGINTVYNEKVKSSKGKGKKKGGKAKLNTGQGSLNDQVSDFNYGYDEYEDFI